jgi:hypothetical protein
MNKLISVCSILLLCAFASNAVSEEIGQSAKDANIASASKAAEAWLKLIADGKFAENWEESACVFKTVLPKEDWIKKMEELKKTFRQKHI